MNLSCFWSNLRRIGAIGRAFSRLALVLLAACAPVPPRPAAVADAAAQQAREAALAARPDWGFRGRVAISQGENGGNAGIRWRQRGSDYDIELSAPITRQSWRLASRAGRVTLSGLEDGERSGGDAEALLLEATGWRIPVAAMSSWARGARGQGSVAEFGSDPEGRPATLVQDGWTIEYRGWFAGEPPLPQRVFARQGEASVRLVVEAWDAP
jgi:outer membrane lipoprotein LolB